GTHTVSLSKQGCGDFEKTISIEEGKITPLEVTLETGKTVTIITDMNGDEIYIDDEFAGTTPLTTSLQFGGHNIYAMRGCEKSDVETINITNITKNDGKTVLRFVPRIGGHEYVDLGLPSGTLWAACNVGATKPEEYGYYFAWGETITKSGYTEKNSATNGKSNSWLKSNGYIDLTGQTTKTKDRTRDDRNPGLRNRMNTETEKGNITMSYDAARTNWGSTWRMPTDADINELIANTTTEWTTINGVNGCLVKSKNNGKSLFFPAAGYRNGTSLDGVGESGGFWSSSPNGTLANKASSLYFGREYFSMGWGSRYYGQSVRPVSVNTDIIEIYSTAHAGIKDDISNPGTLKFTVKGVSFEMINIQGGTFLMGSHDSDSGKEEKPVHSVTLSTYSIGKTEVTQALWQVVMGNNPSNFKGDNLPVDCVSFNDCQEFIRKLNSLTGKKFRLPTEAEWEFAARGGVKSKGYKYSGSNNIVDVAWYSGNSGSTTHPVSTKKSNELGIYDMSGNVWEWCSDWYGYYSNTKQINPVGRTSGFRRVLRGGSWFHNAENCRSTHRNYCEQNIKYDIIGLRLVLDNK
ncbi:MAG: SUMF1/EgtB/PvdO family nonheme iron enzyme, partial [Bacteroidaceae bacterium]|nr:SUMF1/EgtB/PvdO family nonheme iron enzyme [Bacteroidaceae bacterium]